MSSLLCALVFGRKSPSEINKFAIKVDDCIVYFGLELNLIPKGLLVPTGDKLVWAASHDLTLFLDLKKLFYQMCLGISLA
jgi:hypothetical protein